MKTTKVGGPKSDIPTLFECVLVSFKVSLSKTQRQKQRDVNKGMSTKCLVFCVLCATAGLHYHVRDVRFDDAMLRVEVDHGERPALGGNAA